MFDGDRSIPCRETVKKDQSTIALADSFTGLRSIRVQVLDLILLG